MALQPLQNQPLKWKLGSRCDLFVRSEMKWATGEVIGLFTDEQGEWVKVRCGQRVHDVLAHDPDLRVSASDNMVIPVVKMKALQSASNGTNFGRTLKWILSTADHRQLSDRSKGTSSRRH